MEANDNLYELVHSLDPEEQEIVRTFVEFLKQRRSPFVTAVDEFLDQHPELLRRFAE